MLGRTGGRRHRPTAWSKRTIKTQIIKVDQTVRCPEETHFKVTYRLLFAFIFCSIYCRAISFCFFSFFWDIFFFCATSSSGLGTICSFTVRIISVPKISLGADRFLFIKAWDTGCWVELSKLQWKPNKPRNQKTPSSKQERRGPFPGAQLPGCHNMKKTRWLVVFVVNIQLQTNSSIR